MSNQCPLPISRELEALREVSDFAFTNTGLDLGAVDVSLPRRMRMKTMLDFPSFTETDSIIPRLSAALGRLLLVVDFEPIERPDTTYRTDTLPGITDKLVPATYRFQRNELYDVEPLASGLLGGRDERQVNAYTAGSILGAIRNTIKASPETEFFQMRPTREQMAVLEFGQGVIVDSLRYEGVTDLAKINQELAKEAYPPLPSTE